MRLALVALLLVSMSAACGQSLRQIQDGVVRKVDGSLCISIPLDSDQAALRPKVAGIDLYRYQDARAIGIWSTDYPVSGEPLFLTPDKCHPLVEPSVTDLPILSAGVRYGITVLVDAEYRNEIRSYWYRSYFCMIPGEAGSLGLHQVLWDKKEERWKWSACEAGASGRASE